ncbi:unnamed protein product [Peronospora belbahrii]|uniref:Reverse transcriptase domain-containing protein n=1 Tax=Peronospora belbahrii TaxID=622444 RepID=A0ABN8DB97_9STRA|nr:unnamed protein product [Peronospora belbahrii]
MPLINKLLEDLNGALWYSFLDIASWGLLGSRHDRKGKKRISASVTPLGLFEWLQMPFGLKNAPQTYQKLLDNALYEFYVSLKERVQRRPKICLHGEAGCKVGLLARLRARVGAKKVDYLNHRVSDQGLEAHPEDLQSLVDLPLPTTLKAMQSFLGSLNYYGRFIEDCAVYVSILYGSREVDFHDWRFKLRTGDSVVAKAEDEEK